MTRIPFVLFALAFVFVSSPLAHAQCNQTLDQLRPSRLANLEVWNGRLAQGLAHYEDVYNTIIPDDHIFRILQVGTFEPKVVAKEYGQLEFPIGGQKPNVLLTMTFDPTTVIWIDDNTVQHTFTLNASTLLDPATNEYTFFLDGVRQTETVRFVECSDWIQWAYSKSDKLAQKLYDLSLAATTAEQACGLAMAACPVNTTFQQYGSFGECVAFFASLPNPVGVCPHVLASDTLFCRVIHALSALIDPTIHCPHTAVVSHPCNNTCLPTCANCSPNGHCESIASTTDVSSSLFECQCNPGYSGDGHTCVPHTCSAQYQCGAIADYNYARCTNGVCGCADTFNWNGSAAAAAAGHACYCDPDEVVIWRNNVPECLPKGRCYDRWHCPQSYTQVTCQVYGRNPYRTYGSCLCNYGYDNLGFEKDCQCSAPKRVVWSDELEGDVCLAPTECTANWHCTSGSCAVAAGAVVGTCQ